MFLSLRAQERFKTDGDEQVRRRENALGSGEAWRIDSNNGELLLVERDDLAKNLRRALELAIPEAIAYDDCAASARHRIIGRLNGTAELRLNPEGAVVVARNHVHTDPPRRTADRCVHASFLKSGKALNALRMLGQLDVDGIRI